jgi:hypothetical protein
MGPIFTKLNLKDQEPVVVLNAPAEFEPELAELDGRRVVRDLDEVAAVAFALAFARERAELDPLCAALAAKAPGDATLWIAYPKKSSKRYRADFDRDRGWDVLGAAGFEPVRQVAIDADWSALRFRRVAHVETLTRSKAMALTEEGKRRGR